MSQTQLNPAQVRELEQALEDIQVLKSQVKVLEQKLANLEKSVPDKRAFADMVAEALRQIQRNR